MSNTILGIFQIVEIVAIAAAIGYIAFKLFKAIKPMLNPDFFRLMLALIAEAETRFGTGEGTKKLNYTVSNLIEYCEANNINFDKNDLTKLVNLTVSAANLIKSFIASKR